ncbi:MAG TPA: hypothetical protein VIM14_18285, partial [Polyangia bacterium]
MKRDSSTTGSRSSDADKGSSDKLKAALKKAQTDPMDARTWDDLEASVAETQKPDEVRAAYRKALSPGLGPEQVTSLGQRALRFLEEWYAGETAVVVEFLEGILHIDASADWALERLTILRSVNEQWNELLSAYDRVLQGLADGPRRRRLLQDAAGVARDSGNIPRAASYLRALFEAAPGIVEVSSELEHLLEKLGDFATLAQVLTMRLAVVAGHDTLDLRVRLAGLYLDHLGQPDKALDEVEKLLASAALADDRVPCAVAERILGNAGLDREIRRRALDLLRARYAQLGRLDGVVAVLRMAMTFASPDETRALVNEAADMLERKGDLAAAREQLVELVAFQPEEAATRARLKFLAEVTGSPEAYVRGLLAAAGATKDAKLQVALWLEAAQIEEGRQGGTDSAVALYRKTLSSPAAKSDQVLVGLRRLSALLAPDADDRLDLLERQSRLEPSPGMRRGLLGEAADLARAQGHVERALALWEKRLVADANDRKALSRTIEILEGAERWQDLVLALSRRATTDVPWIQRRADLLRVAEIERDQLKNPAKAIAALSLILQTAPSDGEAVAAILDLFAEAGLWPDLLDLGAREGEGTQRALLALFVRLGDACAKQLSNPQGAATWYARALAVDPQTQGLREALFNLVENEAARALAVEGLVRCSTATDDWQGLLAILPHRLALAANDGERARIHREAALLEETRAQRPRLALAHDVEVLKLCPDDMQAESEILRLAEATGDFGVAARSIEEASAGLAP